MTQTKSTFAQFFQEGLDLPPPPPVAHVQQVKPKAAVSQLPSWLTADFVKYVADAENGIKSGFDRKTGLWKPHKSVEGGAATIAFGHKLKPGEVFSKGITTSQAHKLLIRDLQSAAKEAERVVNAKHPGAWNKLNAKQKQMCIDFTFNLGPGGFAKFNKFINAIVQGDSETLQREYIRSAVVDGTRKPLADRNNRFAARFF